MRKICFFLLLFFTNIFICSAQLPEDFYDQVYASGFDFPTGVIFDENGTAYVWEKKGLVHVIDSSGQRLEQPFLDIREEVANFNDHGLMGFALDDGFLTNGYFYVLYAADLHHYFNYGTDSYQADSTRLSLPTFGRVVRYQADPGTNLTTTRAGSRKILLGESISNGIPLLYDFHGLGSIIVADDGTLLISTGDATSNKNTDIGGDSLGTYITKAIELDIATPDEDIGSYKSQYVHNYNGKILRIDPDTGDGLSSNPFFDPENPRAPVSRVWSLGLRNPYRISLAPGSGSHYPEDGAPGVIMACDVGNGNWEELNIVTEPGMNFGWPIYEGNLLMWAFYITDVPLNKRAPNPLSNCDQEYFTFRHLLKAPRKNEDLVFSNPCNVTEPIPDAAFPMEAKFPVLTWSNSKWNKPTRAMVPGFNDMGDISNVPIGTQDSEVKGEAFDGYSSLGGIFYTAEQFPKEYQGKYFGMDFSGWIKVFSFDDTYQLDSVQAFHNDCKDIIHLALNPKDGALYYINLAGELRQISYGGNPAPVAIINSDKNYGSGPLTVQFDASQSYDPNEDPLSFAWDFGNGQTSNELKPSATFSSSGNDIKSFPVTLTVTDSVGAASTTMQVVSVNNTPPRVNISTFNNGDLYSLDKTSLLMLRADVSDQEHDYASLFHEWKVYFHHNDHFHPEPTDFNPVTHTLISPLGCEEEIYYYRIELTVTDPEGLSTTVSRMIFPNCGGNFVEITALSASPDANSIAINWNTTREDSILRYEIQRSRDFYAFATISQAAPKGSGSSYQIIDPSPINGTNVYRIKAIRASGAFSYSNLVTASYPPQTGIRIFPNPASNRFIIRVKEARKSAVELEMYNANGQKVLVTQWESTPGESIERTIISTDLARGMYFYRVINGEEEQVGRLLINP